MSRDGSGIGLLNILIACKARTVKSLWSPDRARGLPYGCAIACSMMLRRTGIGQVMLDSCVREATED
jgi:hypothetical protein